MIRTLFALVAAVPLWAASPDLDEVACTWCHFDEADDFAQSVHYLQGHMLCSDCHGGLPFEEDPDLAKAPETGFIGKPSRENLAEVCAECHAGPAGFFAQGPHHEWRNEANPTCIDCHGNHQVLAADLTLMDETCGSCHDEWSAAFDRGREIRIDLEVGTEHLQRMVQVVDSLEALGRSLRKARPFIDDAREVLRTADAATHALDLGMIEEMLIEARGGLARAEEVVEEYYAEQRRRPRILFAIWFFVLVQVGVLWWKRRDLESGNEADKSLR